MASLRERFKNSWNAFLGRDPTQNYMSLGPSTSYRPDRVRLNYGRDKSIVSAIYNRIAVDASQINLRHVRVDDNGRFKEHIPGPLDNALSIAANQDQTARAFIQDIVMSMFDEGCVAIVPIDTSADPRYNDSYKIYSLRTAKIIQWYPSDVRVLVYNELSGKKEELTLPKKMVAIVENPFYSIMNEQNSTVQRLIRSLNNLDFLNEQTVSGRLDMIIQLPYVVKSDNRKKQAEERRQEIVDQLSASKYGVAYTDGTEKIVQLNRPIENQMWSQVKDLTEMVYNQLGITQGVLDGTADESVMTNYYNHTIEPILTAICEAMEVKFFTETARSQNQAIRFFRDPLKLCSPLELADIADKFTRNELASSNEMRAILGWKPVEDPRADELRNKNISQAKCDAQPVTTDENAPANSTNEDMVKKLIEQAQ